MKTVLPIALCLLLALMIGQPGALSGGAALVKGPQASPDSVVLNPIELKDVQQQDFIDKNQELSEQLMKLTREIEELELALGIKS